MTRARHADDFPTETEGLTLPGGVAKPARRLPEQTLRDLAAFHLMYGQAKTAMDFLRIALWIDPQDGAARRLMGHALARSGQPVEAARMMVSAGRTPGVRLRLGDWKAVGLALLRHGHSALGVKFLTDHDRL